MPEHAIDSAALQTQSLLQSKETGMLKKWKQEKKTRQEIGLIDNRRKIQKLPDRSFLIMTTDRTQIKLWQNKKNAYVR